MNKKFQLLSLVLFVFISTHVVHADDNDEATSSATNNGATIIFVRGHVMVFLSSDDAEAVIAKRGMQVKKNDLITTGESGFVSLSFDTGAVVNIQPLSKVSLDGIDCTSPSSSKTSIENKTKINEQASESENKGCTPVLDVQAGIISSNFQESNSDPKNSGPNMFTIIPTPCEAFVARYIGHTITDFCSEK